MLCPDIADGVLQPGFQAPDPFGKQALERGCALASGPGPRDTAQPLHGPRGTREVLALSVVGLRLAPSPALTHTPNQGEHQGTPGRVRASRRDSGTRCPFRREDVQDTEKDTQGKPQSVFKLLRTQEARRAGSLCMKRGPGVTCRGVHSSQEHLLGEYSANPHISQLPGENFQHKIVELKFNNSLAFFQGLANDMTSLSDLLS